MSTAQARTIVVSALTLPRIRRPESIDAWLNPDPSDLAALSAILDDREPPRDEHRMAA